MDLAEIHKFEYWIENTVEGVLSAVCKNVYRPKLIDTSASPRITFSVSVGGQHQNQKLPIKADPQWIYSAYEGRIELNVTSNRTAEIGSQAQDALVGQVRMRCHQFYFNAWQNTRATLLPVLVFDIRPVECEDSVVDSDDLDNTRLAFSILFSINPLALPNNL